MYSDLIKKMQRTFLQNVVPKTLAPRRQKMQNNLA